MKKTTQIQETQKATNSIILCDGTVKKAYRGKTKFDDTVKNRVTIYNDQIQYELITAYDNTPAKLTPGWFRDAEGYLTANSTFDIPVLTKDKNEITFEEWVDNYPTHNAVIRLKIRQKDGAIYPIAIKVLTDGEPVDHFSDM